MRQFAEAEIRLPNGQHEGRRFRVDRNPFTGHWFDEIDSGRWRRFVATGPTGSGKTLTAFIIPLMYHLFEVGETVLCGLPTDPLVNDKWRDEIRPAIEASNYRDLLPKSGQGSRGGEVTAVQFGNGATLRFMTGGGGDKARAAFHCRVLVVSEADGFDEVGGSSREADKLTQLERRTSSYGDRARVYLECTVSTEKGRTWREYTGGSRSRLALRCPQCRAFVTPEREHLVGCRGAEVKDVIAAGEQGRLICPACGVEWSEQDRTAANHDSLLVHKDQRVNDAGSVEGDVPRTRTLGFRWTAANNLLVNMRHIAEEEWAAAQDPNEENAEKKMRQFVWALPHVPDKVDLTALESQVIARRTAEFARGVVPADATHLTVGMDLGGYLCHWVAVAWRPGATPHVVDHGRWEVPREGRALELALMLALNSFREDVLLPGFYVGRLPQDPSEDVPRKRPDVSFIDYGWKGRESVVPFCLQAGVGHFPVKGFGESQFTDTGSSKGKVVFAGDGYKVVLMPEGWHLVDANSDAWKEWAHERLKTPVGKEGGLTLFLPSAGDPNVHLSFAKHLTAEKQVQEYVAGRGLVTKYERISKNNHFLDALSLACVAGHAAGVRLIEAVGPKHVTTPAPATSAGRPVNPLTNYKRW